MHVFRPKSIQFKLRRQQQFRLRFIVFQNGFTLIEMMVVIGIVALLSGTVLMSVNTVKKRQLHSHAETMVQWLRWVQENSKFSGLSYGVALDNEDLVVVVPYTGRWLRVKEFMPWERPSGVNIQIPTRISEAVAPSKKNQIPATDALSFQPFMVFNHTGFITPQDKIVLQRADEKIAVVWSDTQTITVTTLGDS